MSGFDKAMLARRLVRAGWVDAPEREGMSVEVMAGPDLVERIVQRLRSGPLYVYHARDLMYALGSEFYGFDDEE